MLTSRLLWQLGCAVRSPSLSASASAQCEALCTFPRAATAAAVLVTTVRQGLHLQGSPLNTTVLPGGVAAALSTATGPGLTLGTAGVLGSFTVVARDVRGSAVFVCDDVLVPLLDGEARWDHVMLCSAGVYASLPPLPLEGAFRGCERHGHGHGLCEESWFRFGLLCSGSDLKVYICRRRGPAYRARKTA
jgi:hypothetical protein